MKITQLSITKEQLGSKLAIIDFVIHDGVSSAGYMIAGDDPTYPAACLSVGRFLRQALSNEELAQELHALTSIEKFAKGRILRLKGVFDDRMTLENGVLLIDGDPAPTSIERFVLRLLTADGTPKDMDNWTAFGNFLTKLYSNQSEFVREQFFGWLKYETLQGQGFTLTPEGDVIAYKGCAGTVDRPVSIQHGSAIVDDVRVTGAIPNMPGSVIEMPRSQVTADPAIACAPGLHVGTYAYAHHWAKGVLLKVVFSPAHVVSVPTDCEAQKLRVFRYRVLEVIDAPETSPVVYESSQQPVKGAPGQAKATPEVKVRKKLIKQALKRGTPVKFIYNGRQRKVAPAALYKDAKGWKLDALESGQYKTFFLARMTKVKVKPAKNS